MSGKMKKQTSSKKIQLVNPDNDGLSPPETSAITTEPNKALIANNESRNLLANKKESIESIRKHQTEKKLLKQSQEDEEKLSKSDDKSGKPQSVENVTNNKVKKSPYEIIFELNQQLANELEVCRKKNVLKESQIRELDSQNFSLREYITSLELSLEEFKSQYDQTIQENQNLKDKLANGVKRDDDLIEKKASDLFNHLHLYLTGRPYEWSNTARVSTARPNLNDLSRVSLNASSKQTRAMSPQCESNKEHDEEMDQDFKDKNTESFLVEESVEEVESDEDEEETENDDEEDEEEEEQDEEEEEDIEEVEAEDEEEEEMDTDEEEADEEEMDTDEEEEPSETDIVIGKDQSEYMQQPTAEPGLFTILETSEMNDKTVFEEANVLIDETEVIEEDELSTNTKETTLNSLNETYDIGVPTLVQRKSVSFADNLVVDKNVHPDQQDQQDMPRYKKTPKPARPSAKSSYVDLEERPVRLNCEATDLRVVNKENNLKPPRPPKPILKTKEPMANENLTSLEEESACDVKLLSSDEPLKLKSRKDSLNGKKSIESAESSNRRRSRVFSLSEPDETVSEANETLTTESIQVEPLVKTPNLNASNGKPILKPKTIFKSKQKAADNEENVARNQSVMAQSVDKAQNLQGKCHF